MNKPTIISHFLHTGPALSEINSFACLVPSTTTNSSVGTTNNNIDRLSLPTPIPCNPFSKTENARIQHAWKLLNLSEYHHHSSSHSNPELCKSIKFDRKGKGKILSETIEIDSSSQPNLNQNQTIQDHEDQNRVLNLSMESEPYIVPVGLDSLFTVDIRKLKLYPAFWHGPQLDVYRGEWFFPSTSKHKFYPCDPELSFALEAAYDQIKPWDLSYQDELRSALKIGTEAEDKLKVHLNQFNHDVIFQSATQGRLYSRAVSSRISKTILTNFFTSISNKTAGHSGGTVVVRGWDEAQSWSGLVIEDENQVLDQKNNNTDKKSVKLTDSPTGFNTTADMIQEEILENSNVQVSELVLVIHGIGQKLAQSYDSFDFVHACNQLRLECHKASTTDDKMKDFLQNKRAQFIPIRWRHSLNFEMEGYDGTAGVESEIQENVSNNTFTMKDIQIPDSIQFVREVVTGLVLDVPLYMSPKQHKRMVAAVIEQANKVYQLFCQRNPYYTGKKVSILAHSLGAALTVDILSRQPDLWTMNVQTGLVLHDTLNCLSSLNHFCFDTCKVFLVGSPVAFFFHLHRAQLIAREGVCKLDLFDIKYSNEWRKVNRITASEAGQYGCLAAETIYNVYVSTDPVAYCMNACVDSQYSKQIKPMDADSFTKKFLELIKINKRKKSEMKGGITKRNVSLSSLSSLVAVNSWLNSSNNKKTDEENVPQVLFDKPLIGDKPHLSKSDLPSSIHRSSSFINSWSNIIKKRSTFFDHSNEEPPKKIKQENPLGKMRFQALNPTGSIDFVIPSLGLNQYVDMVTAHAAYWSDTRFARLILIGLFGQDDALNLVGQLELHPT